MAQNSNKTKAICCKITIQEVVNSVVVAIRIIFLWLVFPTRSPEKSFGYSRNKQARGDGSSRRVATVWECGASYKYA